MITLKPESALNLTLSGSVGSFSVGDGSGDQNSIEVRYFLTHVGLDFSSGSDEQLLSNIAPVREIFDFKELEFDEIMQRDIDDARVSAELVPYLLDSRSRDLVKLFPPIIVVVLPTKEGANGPANHYPLVTTETRPSSKEDQLGEGGEYRVTRAGEVGSEVFAFEQPVSGEKVWNHDLARLRLNTERTRLVIVDGQHRAMALLALYRNLKGQWSDERRAPFREYYAEWTTNYIKQFNLREIKLPVMLCTFPQLDETYEGDFDLKKAARSIFLTLNKTARKVTESRNRLLDDSDLIAHFLRLVLSDIKDGGDQRSNHSLRIHNVELDQGEDRTRLTDRISVTGVSHVYYLIEHLMLNHPGEDVVGLYPRRGVFALRKDLEGYNTMERLDGVDKLGTDVVASTSRDLFSQDAAAKLGTSFMERYGRFIVSAFERFGPYEAHNRAVLALREELETHEDRKLIPILFDGQGIGTVFERHRSNLRDKLKQDYFEGDVPEVEEVLVRLNATKQRIDQSIERLYEERADSYFGALTSGKSDVRNEDGEWIPEAVRWLNKTYDNVFTTVAFQTALIGGFFSELERAHGVKLEGTDVEALFSEYIDQLTAFFQPTSLGRLKRLHKVFDGELDTGDGQWVETPTNWTFRSVVYTGEMKPDQWPKYKYLIAEIWAPEDDLLAVSLMETREVCRRQAFDSLYKSKRSQYCVEHGKREEDLEPEEVQTIKRMTYDALSSFLKLFKGEVPTLAQLSESVTSEPDLDDDASD